MRPTTLRAPREVGLTLVDTIVAVIVVAIALGLAYPGFKVAKDPIDTGGLRDRAERAGDRILRRITEEIRAGHLTDPGLGGEPPALTITRPKSGVAPDHLNAEGDVPSCGETRVIRFRETETVKESVENEDLNRDGDRTDEFSLGVVEVVAGGTARPILPDARVMLGRPGCGGDLNGDGSPDPLFRVNGRNVEIRLQMFVRAEGGRIVTTVVRGSLRLRSGRN